MKRFSLVSLTFLLALLPARLFAKAATSRITIEGNRLKFEITNPKTLAQFNVWSGAGTSSNQAQSFIIDWSHPLAREPQGLARYQVSFYANFAQRPQDPPIERLIYVAFYEFDPSTQQGYVYLPGKGHPWYSLDASTITHGVEGKWFHASTAWDNVAGPLVRYETAASHSLGKEATCFAIRRYLAKREAPGSDVTDIVGVPNCIPSSGVEFVAEPAHFNPPVRSQKPGPPPQ